MCGGGGLRGERVRDYAVHLGIAVQLTDVAARRGRRAAAGRVYLARQDAKRWVSDTERLAGGRAERAARPSARAVRRARSRARYAWRSARPTSSARALRPAQAMGAIYRDLLDALEKRGFPGLSPALRLSKARRVAVPRAPGYGARVV